MTDKEMLELAAKAGGVPHRGWREELGALLVDGPDGRPLAWNPRADDGDAFRLAHAIDAEICHGMVIVDRDDVYHREDYLDLEGFRRAITCAAVAIGMKMP